MVGSFNISLLVFCFKDLLFATEDLIDFVGFLIIIKVFRPSGCPFPVPRIEISESACDQDTKLTWMKDI